MEVGSGRGTWVKSWFGSSVSYCLAYGSIMRHFMDWVIVWFVDRVVIWVMGQVMVGGDGGGGAAAVVPEEEQLAGGGEPEMGCGNGRETPMWVLKNLEEV
ncbi:hypothetical protein E3N88_24395 [Mikania micrantha]|uniref:Uncharacterized protein n=1 Tax=Mikania micrantha TaxID=192012 RepID=A0A5N6N2B7_9ASTR|nr:hypothetical protein E3N88_24395 [Mikania micrantha]